MPWTGGQKGPEEMAKVFDSVAKAWETKAFDVRDVIEQDDRVAEECSGAILDRQWLESGQQQGVAT